MRMKIVCFDDPGNGGFLTLTEEEEEEMATQRAATPEEREALKVLGMETGVAYMPIPRCKTCRWWNRLDQLQEGWCNLLGTRNSGTRFLEPGHTIVTRSDFGCVQWEARDDG